MQFYKSFIAQRYWESKLVSPNIFWIGFLHPTRYSSATWLLKGTFPLPPTPSRRPFRENQALCALLFLYREVLGVELDSPIVSVRAKRPKRLPTVLTKSEVQLLISSMSGKHQLMAKLLYGSGLRLMECIRLRIKDIDFHQHQVIVRDGKGLKDRVTVLPDAAVQGLHRHLRRVKLLHEDDLANGFGGVSLPYALAVKYPSAQFEWKWQYIFPSKNISRDPRSGDLKRHHADPSSLQNAVRRAVKSANINKHVTPHALRHINVVSCRRSQVLCGAASCPTTGIVSHPTKNQSEYKTLNIKRRAELATA